MKPKRDPVTALLMRARRRITDPEHWTLGELASAPGSYPGERLVCDGGHPAAARWCAVGALQAETTTARRRPDGFWEIARDADAFAAAYDRLHHAAGGGPMAVEQVNDGQGHAAVLALYDAAIRAK